MLEKLITLVIGGVIASLGFLAKRRIEKRGTDEQLARHERLLAINKEMTAQRVSAADLHRLELVLTNRALPTELPPTSAISVTTFLDRRDASEIVTQAELNGIANDRALEASQKLYSAVAEVSADLPPERRQYLEVAQAAWEAFRDADAAFAASMFEGGAIAPTIYHIERASSAAKRELELLRQHEFEKRL